MAKKDIRGHLGGKRIQLCFIIFNLLFLMNVVSSWKVKVNFAHVKPHASNLLFVGLLRGSLSNFDMKNYIWQHKSVKTCQQVIYMAMMEILVKVSIGAVSSTVREKIRKGEKEGDSW